MDEDLIKTILTTGILKRIDRTGWVKKGVKNPESVSDHSYRVAVIAMLVAPLLDLDQAKLIKMALLHDLGEAVIGDVIWEKGKKIIGSQSEKHKDEGEAVKQIFDKTNNKEYVELWEEFELQTSKEAQVLKQIDKLEMAIQAYEYEREGNPSEKLNEFWENAEKYLQDKELGPLFNLLVKMRSSNES
ncbi:MAG TPA: HD domain-containing protein [Patescibacteria group bacterium]|nr:HD domain-containing protein [Patescibacteria group bacterium]